MAEDSSSNDLNTPMAKTAEMMVGLGRENYDIELDFTADSLLLLDKAISESHADRECLDEMALGFGSYVVSESKRVASALALGLVRIGGRE